MFFVNYDRELPSAAPAVAAWLALAIAGFTLYDVVGKRVRLFMAWSVVTVCYLLVIGEWHAAMASGQSWR